MYFPKPLRWGILALSGLAGFATAFANTPGGGSTGADVTLSTTSSTATLSNGIITATINIAGGDVTSMLYNGVQTVGPGDNAYFSMDGGSTFEEPHNCVLSVVTNTTDMVDISCKQTYVSGNSAYIHDEDIDIHYVLRRGATGLYVYAILTHPASYPALSMGEWRMVWKLPNDSQNFFFEKEYVDNFRHHDMLNYYEFTHATTSRIQEIALSPPNDGTHIASTRAGLYNCKYEFSEEYSTFGVWGHASDTNQKGVWFIPGSQEYFNDGPNHQDLDIAESYSLMHFGRDHYGGSSTSVASGTAWSKIFGPYLLYCDTGGADACWADAQAQAAAEQAAWPYSWLTGNALYPLAVGRGSVSGKFVVADSLKPAVSGANAWVGLATPSGSGTYDWQQDSLNYEYWVKADGNGNFAIPNVRPGTYTLYGFVSGAVGQYSQASVTVAAGQTTALGTVTWTVVHPGNWIAWEIGVPDRTATEFRHGKSDYYVPYIWLDWPNEFTNPLNFNIGSSNWAHDWNYAHGFWEVGGTDQAVGTLSTWPWNINFTLPSTPASGNAVLTIAFAGSYGAHLRIFVNNTAMTGNPTFDDTSIPDGGGDALLREGVHANYGVSTFTFATTKLHSGSNSITLLQINGTSAEANHMMYDYIDLEMPGSTPTSQPPVGRSFIWAGGNGNNSWDAGTFINWSNSGGSATFNQGDVVTFDDTGSNSPAVVLNDSLKPNGITVNSTKNYTFTGSGAITGTTSLLKSGSGMLTLANSGTNNYSGATTVSGGILQITGTLSNAGSVEVQSGATLAVGGSVTTGSLQVDSGGTLTGSAGSITATILNNGTMTLSSGGTFHLNGAVTNNGTMRLNNGTQLSNTGAFTNNGVLDLITASQTLPSNFVNHGVVLDSSVVKVQGISFANGVVTLQIQSYTGHNYQLQWSGAIVSPSWQNLGAPVAGTGGVLTFTDSNGLGSGVGFYRVTVAP